MAMEQVLIQVNGQRVLKRTQNNKDKPSERMKTLLESNNTLKYVKNK